MPQETHMPNVSKIGAGLVPPSRIFWFWPGGLEKHHLLDMKKEKNWNCPRALQVGSFCEEWRGEQILQRNLCSEIVSSLWKYTFIVRYSYFSFIVYSQLPMKYIEINVYFHNVELILERRFFYKVSSPVNSPDN